MAPCRYSSSYDSEPSCVYCGCTVVRCITCLCRWGAKDEPTSAHQDDDDDFNPRGKASSSSAPPPKPAPVAAKPGVFLPHLPVRLLGSHCLQPTTTLVISPPHLAAQEGLEALLLHLHLRLCSLPSPK